MVSWDSMGCDPLVNEQKTIENYCSYLKGKVTISMAIFHSKLLKYQRVGIKKRVV